MIRATSEARKSSTVPRKPNSQSICRPPRASQTNAWYQLGNKAGRSAVARLRDELALIAAQVGSLFNDIDIKMNAKRLTITVAARLLACHAIARSQTNGHRNQATRFGRMSHQGVHFNVVPQLLP